MTHGQPLQLRVTGRYRRLPGLSPVEISVANGPDVSRYRITEQDTQVLNLPADASVIVTAGATFMAPRTLRDNDPVFPIFHRVEGQPLSVAISLQPASP